MYFIKNHDTPILFLNPFHRFFGLPGPPLGVGDHVEGGDQDPAAHGLVLGVGGEPTDRGVVGS